MNPHVRKVIRLMREDLRQELSLTEMARSADVSPWWLCHLFKAETGSSPLQYFKALRRERAKELLETSSFSIREIMARVDFRDENHFVRDFKRAYGLPPLQYRNRHGSAYLSTRARGIKRQQERLKNSKIGQ